MRKKLLLSFYLACTCSISACSNFSDDGDYFVDDKDAQVIDATTNPYNKCGVDGISCNDTALINYSKTEADYRAYGERTKRDHLYTQAAAGNNITATRRPGIEEDIVTEYKPVNQNNTPAYDDGAFSQTGIDNLESTPYTTSPISSQQIGHANAPVGGYINGGYTNGPEGYVSNTGYTMGMMPNGYEVYCNSGYNCEGFVSTAMGDNQFSSEFTEESFDIADYVETDNEDMKFIEYGNKGVYSDDAEIGDIDDNTILTWEAKEGDNLRELLTKWSAIAGWKLLWNTNRNYILNAGVMFKGKFTDVSSALIRAFARARPAPIATYYKGNRVIVIETTENENAY